MHLALLPAVFVLFPDGAVRSRVQRVLLGSIGTIAVLSMASAAVGPGVIVTTPDKHGDALLPVRNPVGIGALDGLVHSSRGPLFALGLLTGLLPVVWTAWAWRRSTGLRRRQFRWATLIQGAGIVVPPAVAVIQIGRAHV